MYDIAVDGLRDIKRFITLRRVARDPLSCTVDGSNVYFRTSYFPLSWILTGWRGFSPALVHDTRDIPEAPPKIAPPAIVDPMNVRLLIMILLILTA